MALSVTNAVSAKTSAGRTLKEQRFRSARPLKANGRFRFRMDISATDTFVANDVFPVFVLPSDLGEVYLTDVVYIDGTDADAVFDGFTTDTFTTAVPLAAGTTTEKLGASMTSQDRAIVRCFDVAGETFDLIATGVVEPDSGILFIEFECTREIDETDIALVGSG